MALFTHATAVVITPSPVTTPHHTTPTTNAATWCSWLVAMPLSRQRFGGSVVVVLCIGDDDDEVASESLYKKIFISPTQGYSLYIQQCIASECSFLQCSDGEAVNSA